MKWRVYLNVVLVAISLTTGVAFALSPLVVDTPPVPKTAETPSTGKPTEIEASKLGVEAVMYGLPLVMMEITRRMTTNVIAPEPNGHAPINQFGNVLKYPTAADKDVVRPNIDSLPSFAWLDLTKEPIILSVPTTDERFYMLPIMDAWTNIFASPGKRTTGTIQSQYAIVGPNWNGDLPEDVGELKSPTNIVLIQGRTQANGPADYQVVNAIQAKYKLTPLSSWGKPYTPPPGTFDPGIDMKTPPIEQVSRMDAATFFKALTTAMKSNPPPKDDDPALVELARIGIVPGQDFDMSKLDPAIAKNLEGCVQRAIEKLQAVSKKVGIPINGWNLPSRNVASFGVDYNLRAEVALIGLGANLPSDVLYPSTFIDGDGEPLVGSKRYILRFKPSRQPPTDAFWSVTMYNAEAHLVDNPLNRYEVSSWMPLKLGDDGSLTIYIQKDAPDADKESNWLPAPIGRFSLTMRIYSPQQDALYGNWEPPPIVHAPTGLFGQ
jgi:hypothetical protein